MPASAPRRMDLRWPLLACAGLAALGSATFASLPAERLGGSAIQVTLTLAPWVSFLATAAGLLLFRIPMADVFAAVARVVAHEGVRLVLHGLGGVWLWGLTGAEPRPVAVSLVAWYGLMLLVGELAFVAHFVNGFDAGPKADAAGSDAA